MLFGIFPSALSASFIVLPIFSGVSHACTQVNASYIMCPDGASITIGFSISAPYAPYYGNFSAYTTDPLATSEPYSITGSICSVPSSTTVTCYINLKPVPMTSGNGIIDSPISLVLASQYYPQVRFNYTVNVTIVHNLTSAESSTLLNFNTVNITYSKMNMGYSYFCGEYKICNASLEGNLTSLNANVVAAANSISQTNLTVANAYLTNATYLIDTMSMPFSSYENVSNKIVNNIIHAKALLSTIRAAYAANEENLSRCVFSNKTTYAQYLNNSIAALSSYSMLNTLNGSSYYLGSLENLSKNETHLISACSVPRSVVILPKGMSIPYYTVIIAVVLFLILVYSIVKIREGRFISSVRGYTSDTEDNAEGSASSDAQASGANVLIFPNGTAGAEEVPRQQEIAKSRGTVASSPSGTASDEEQHDEESVSLGSTFDEWLSKTFSLPGSEEQKPSGSAQAGSQVSLPQHPGSSVANTQQGVGTSAQRGSKKPIAGKGKSKKSKAGESKQ